MAELRVTSTGTIKLFESDDTSSVTIASPASLGGDRTITLPDANVDLTEVNTMPIANLDIDGGTDIGAAITDSDLFIIDDGAGGTNRKTAASRLKTYIGTSPVTALNNATANELVTVGSTTTELDAEANLTFDGAQLSILDSDAGTDNLLIKTTGDNQISMALEKSDYKFDIGLDHDNAGSKNFYIRERSKDGSLTNAKRLVMDENGDIYLPDESDSGRIQIMTSYTNPQIIIYGPTNSNTTKMSFRNGNGAVGTIATNGSATAYNTSSDYRLKENEVAISDGITRLKQLKPYKFNFKIDADTTVDGFFAHEVSSIVPEAITGEKDGAEMQGIDQSKLVPLLTAALKEAVTKIEALEARVTTLEG